jgi:hypothetical protein
VKAFCQNQKAEWARKRHFDLWLLNASCFCYISHQSELMRSARKGARLSQGKKGRERFRGAQQTRTAHCGDIGITKSEVTVSSMKMSFCKFCSVMNDIWSSDLVYKTKVQFFNLRAKIIVLTRNETATLKSDYLLFFLFIWRRED